MHIIFIEGYLLIIMTFESENLRELRLSAKFG